MNDILALPLGTYEGANRYDTDNEYVLHLWSNGQSYDIRIDKHPKETRRKFVYEGWACPIDGAANTHWHDVP